MLFRHAALLLVLAALVVFVAEPVLIQGDTPLLARLSTDYLDAFYERVLPISASLLGFYIAAVAILAQLDPTRKIVDELKRGESFSLLIANMLVTILMLFLLTFLGIAGSLALDSCFLISTYEWVLLSTTGELALSGALFGVVTYKVATDRGKHLPS